MIFTAIGMFAALLVVIADIPYILDTIRKKTKPQRVTWGILFLINSVAFANQFASGATDSLWIFGSASVMTGVIFLLSLWHGVGGRSRQDAIVLTISLSGVVLWVLFNDPWLSIVATIISAVVALVPTFVKARIDPESETRITWLLVTIAAALATISVGSLDIKLLILPLNATILQAYLAYLLYRPRPGKVIV